MWILEHLNVRFGEKRTFRNIPKIFTKLTNMDGRFTPDTVEKLRFEISGDFICVLSAVLYCRYEGVVRNI